MAPSCSAQVIQSDGLLHGSDSQQTSPHDREEVGSISPAFLQHTSFFPIGRILVIMSVPLSSVLIFSSDNRPASSTSLINDSVHQCAWISSEMKSFYERCIALDYHENTVYFSVEDPTLEQISSSTDISLHASVIAIYWPIVDRATHFCSLDCQEALTLQRLPNNPL
ncbi:hypothetical protein Nepgr_015890 [Nepenthes gracilis]|uniref:Uncharacterized protein n=1 Tax=Nepenthes gracilis TaxID=150966 RepID=A0AAD3SNS4_NEPGR|nr:hypothetical protein Nepgr_015890 [Nepenthes gracilis]